MFNKCSTSLITRPSCPWLPSLADQHPFTPWIDEDPTEKPPFLPEVICNIQSVSCGTYKWRHRGVKEHRD